VTAKEDEKMLQQIGASHHRPESARSSCNIYNNRVSVLLRDAVVITSCIGEEPGRNFKTAEVQGVE